MTVSQEGRAAFKRAGSGRTSKQQWPTGTTTSQQRLKEEHARNLVDQGHHQAVNSQVQIMSSPLLPTGMDPFV